LVVGAAQGQDARFASDFAAMGAAKILCSAVFVSDRDLHEALRNSATLFLSDADSKLLLSGAEHESEAGIELDRENGTVSVTLRGFVGRARYYGDQGCVILPPGFDDVFFEPLDVETALPDSQQQAWPMGDLLPEEPLPKEVDQAMIDRAIDWAFADGSLTAAFLVVYKGRIVGERYGQGADKDTQLESWSMGKSLTATLFGVLVRQGLLGLHDPAPVPLWHKSPDDPRAKIRNADLLRMSSGLRFSSGNQPYYEWGREIADHLYIYAGGIDAFHFSITRPAELPPNTTGRYRNCDPLTIGYIIRRTVEAAGEDYLSWPQKALFDRIGIRKQVLEPDPYGNFLLSGYDYGTARNWARLGLLYLQDGIWQGERILPEGWVEFVSTPAPAWEQPIYGGLFWVNGAGWWEMPQSTYYMAGAGGQYVIIIPTHDLVVVRLGHIRGQEVAESGLNRTLRLLMRAVSGEH
jgi:CubicO group peptidase (beta-lactamase class C family)